MNTTVGELRRAIENLPDDMLILPDWAEPVNVPDWVPSILLHDILVVRNDDEDPYLSVILEPELEDEEEGRLPR
jgi:hypothetical protein